MLLAISEFPRISRSSSAGVLIARFPRLTGKFLNNAACNKAGGALGVVTALIAYYIGLAELLVRDESWLTLPLGVISKRAD